MYSQDVIINIFWPCKSHNGTWKHLYCSASYLCSESFPSFNRRHAVPPNCSQWEEDQKPDKEKEDPMTTFTKRVSRCWCLSAIWGHNLSPAAHRVSVMKDTEAETKTERGENLEWNTYRSFPYCEPYSSAPTVTSLLSSLLSSHQISAENKICRATKTDDPL